MTCDVCGLYDTYRGRGDGIGSCDCARCDCGAARGSYLCDCPPDDPDDWFDDDVAGPPWWEEPPKRPMVTVEIPGVSW